MPNKILSLVIPCFNEEAVIETTHREVVKQLGGIDGIDLEIIYVDDGSRDSTLTLLRGIVESETSATVKVVPLARNFGHQPAITAGLETCSGDVVAIIDADLQDPPEVVREMLELWRNGAEVVSAIRTKRKEGVLKRAAYFMFYRLYSKLSDIDVAVDAGDFSLMDRRVVDHLNGLPERNRFVRGLRSWLGFKQATHTYERHARAAGETKYSLPKLVRLAFDGLFSFSSLPLTMVFTFGFVLSIFAFAVTAFLIVVKVFDITFFGNHPDSIPGYFSTVCVILLVSGIQLVSLGIIGEYVGRIYHEVKNRPLYIAYDVVERRTSGSPPTGE